MGGCGGAGWVVDGAPKVVFDVVVENGRIVELELIGDTARHAQLDVQIG